MCISNSGLSANSNRFLFNLSILQTEKYVHNIPFAHTGGHYQKL